MKSLGKFLLYFFILIVILISLLETVEYPHQYEKRIASQSQEIAPDTHSKSGNLYQPTNHSKGDDSSFINETLSQLRNLKELVNNIKCVSKAVLKGLPLTDAQELTSAENDKLFEVLGRDFRWGYHYKRVNETDDNSYEKSHLAHLLNENNTNPSEYNNRLVLEQCIRRQYNNLCSDEVIENAISVMSDDVQNWLIAISTFESDEPTDYIPLLEKLAYAETNVSHINRYYIEAFYTIYPDIYNVAYQAHGLALDVVRKYRAADKYLKLANLCKDNVFDICKAIGDRLVSDNNNLVEVSIGHNIRMYYYEHFANLEMADKELKAKIRKHNNDRRFHDSLKLPLIDGEVYIDAYMNAHDKSEFDALNNLHSKVQDKLALNPDYCVL